MNQQCRSIRSCAVALLGALVLPALAQRTPPPRIPPTLTLGDAFRITLESSTDVHISRLREKIAETGIRRADGAFDTELFAEAETGMSDTPVSSDPIGVDRTREFRTSAGIRTRLQTGTDVEISASTSYVDDRSGGAALDPGVATSASVVVSQDMFRGRGRKVNRAPIHVARNNWQIAMQDLRIALMRDLFEVESAYWELYYGYTDLSVRQQQLARANELVRRAEAQVTVGEAAPIDVTRAKASAATQSVAIVDTRNRIERLRHRLLSAMGALDTDPSQVDFELTDRPTTPPEQATFADALADALAHRPEAAQADLDAKNASLRWMLAKNATRPDVELYGQLTQRGLDDGLGGSVSTLARAEYPAWEVGVSLTLPLGNRVAEADLEAAQFRVREAEVRTERTREAIIREVADTLADLRAAQARTTAAVEARELAAQLLKAEETSFGLGRSDSLDVLDAQAALSRAERDEARARVDSVIAIAAVHVAQGTYLEANSVEVTER